MYSYSELTTKTQSQNRRQHEMTTRQKAKQIAIGSLPIGLDAGTNQ